MRLTGLTRTSPTKIVYRKEEGGHPRILKNFFNSKNFLVEFFFLFIPHEMLLTDARLVLPLVLGFATAFVCPMKSAPWQPPPQQPPDYVFGVVWPVLYLLLGFAWTRSKGAANLLVTVLVLLLNVWIVVFSCHENSKLAAFILAAILGSIAGSMALLSRDAKAVFALVPLLSWCIIALLLNWEIIEIQAVRQ